MRLTMRTLLNWINRNLLEEDAVLVAQKVEESDLAKALKNQIEEVMRQEQLPAPMVLDGTPLGNANSSAEYLDNAMASVHTVEYEKFCLHSDVMLGEVAACHEILSHVLTDWPQVSSELRTRLCGLYQFMDTGSEFSIPLPKAQPKATVKAQVEDVLADVFPEMEVELSEAVSDGGEIDVPKTELKETRKAASNALFQEPAEGELADVRKQLSRWKSIAIASLVLFLFMLLLDILGYTPGRIWRG